MVLPQNARRLVEIIDSQARSGMTPTPETAKYLALCQYHNICPGEHIVGGTLSASYDYVVRAHGPIPGHHPIES
jgi:hypothetical protein